MDLTDEGLVRRINALRVGFAGYSNTLLNRNREYLRAFSPEFNSKLGEHDQWRDPIQPEDVGHVRSSFNIARPTAELWASLEASELPAIRWQEGYLPTPAPSLDQQQNAIRQETYRATKLVRQQVSTMREQAVLAQARKARLAAHFYRGVLRKNVYGHSWLKSVPLESTQRFSVYSDIDPSTVYPIWSTWDDTKLDAILVAYRRSARLAAAQYPEAVILDDDGITVTASTYYTPTKIQSTDADRSFVWVEDYWVIDESWEQETSDGDPVTSMVVNMQRVNEQIVERTDYPGWKTVPYFLLENPNERDRTGLSDVATVLPFQSALNQFMSEQADVIHGESRPKFKHRGTGQITLNDEGVIDLDDDEDIEQIAIHLDVFPTQVHGQQLSALLSRATGLPPVVWGEIQAAQNSGRALSTSWRATASRMIPRTLRNSVTLDAMFGFWVDCMELYDWNSARELFQGNRDFELKWPNQEPRDFQEVTLDAINKLQAGIIPLTKAMELTGDESPDETLEAVRSDYIDTIIHPEKAQSYMALQQQEQAIAIQAQQAQLQAQSAQAQLAQLAAAPPGGAPGGAQQAAAAAGNARTQAAQQGAPTLAENQNVPSTQAASPANAGNQSSTLIQDGQPAMNRIIQKRQF